MIADIEQCRQLGCDGVVIGMLLSDGSVDTRRCAAMIDQAGSMQVTFHRAFDRVQDPMRSLEQIIDLGCTRILTSGLCPTADAGKDMLRALVEAAADRITVMPGSGVRAANIVELAEFTGATAFHSSARSTCASAMDYVNPAMAEDLSCTRLDAGEVADMRRRLDALTR